MDTLPLHGKIDNTKPLNTFIYALIDPETSQVRYIGKANNTQRRLREHLRDNHHTHKTNWIRSLLAKGLEPILQILEEVSIDQWQERETYWIIFYRQQGAPLTNGSDGGDGIVNPTPEERIRRAQSTRLIMSDLQERARRIAILNTPESVKKRAKARKESGYQLPITPQHCLNVSKSVRNSQQIKKDSPIRRKTKTSQKYVSKYTRGIGQRRKKKQRAAVKCAFLIAYTEKPNISYACHVAGISRQTFYDWRDNDEAFKAQLTNLADMEMSITERLDMFLCEYAITGNVAASTRKCEIKRATLYYWLNNDETFFIRFNKIKSDLEARYG